MDQDRRAGISMVEVMVTVIIANVGIAALVSSFSHYQKQEIETRARSTALLAAQTVLETMRSSDFDTLLTQYNDVPGDDPNGQDRGSFFSIAGLNPPRIGGVALNHGEIILVHEENPDERQFGRDLGTNGLPYPDGLPDGKPDGLDLDGDGLCLLNNLFSSLFDLNLNGVLGEGNLPGLFQAPRPQEACRSMRCAIRVTYEVLGELRQIQLDTQLTRPTR
jgi:type II secretory pathway pseudopilin PulG